MPVTVPSDYDLTQHCPCGSNQAAAQCCWSLLQGSQVAQNAEQLMRSRYCAYYWQQLDYLVQTHHSDYREADLAQLLQRQFEQPQGWIKLEVLKHQAKAATAKVEFKAYFHDQHQVYCLHERSNFIYQDAHWFYSDGKIIANGEIGWPRNENCWCGSGKKAKRCPH